MKKPFDPLENDVARVLRKKRTVNKSLTVAKPKSAGRTVHWGVRVVGQTWYLSGPNPSRKLMEEKLNTGGYQHMELVRVTVEPVKKGAKS